jgi:hypothetical protein
MPKRTKTSAGKTGEPREHGYRCRPPFRDRPDEQDRKGHQSRRAARVQPCMREMGGIIVRAAKLSAETVPLLSSLGSTVMTISSQAFAASRPRNHSEHQPLAQHCSP